MESGPRDSNLALPGVLALIAIGWGILALLEAMIQ